MSLRMLAALAGIFFGIWPLFMNKSGLSGNVSSAIFSLGTLVVLIPVALGSNGFNLPQANWAMVAFACVTAALGLLSFNGMLAGATAKEVGTLFVIMILVQTATPSLYSVVMNGGITLSKLAGFALAIVAGVLLTR
jgi:hypothetical protein